MLFLFLIHAEIQVVDTKLEELKKAEEEIKCAITGKKKKTKEALHKQLKLVPKTNCPSHYKGAQISIEQGGCHPSNDTTAADMRQIHDDVHRQANRPMMVACRHSHDVFEPQDKLRDPILPPQS